MSHTGNGAVQVPSSPERSAKCDMSLGIARIDFDSLLENFCAAAPVAEICDSAAGIARLTRTLHRQRQFKTAFREALLEETWAETHPKRESRFDALPDENKHVGAEMTLHVLAYNMDD